MASTKKQVLSVYRLLLRESSKFSSYNYRNYALRRIRGAFRENRGIIDQIKVADKIVEATKNLETIKRQVIIGNLYKVDKLVIEYPSKSH